MLTQNTLDTLRQLKLTGMCDALEQQRAQPDTHDLAFEERLALLIDREVLHRENRRLERLLKAARLRVPACVEDMITAIHGGWNAPAWRAWPAVTGSANP